MEAVHGSNSSIEGHNDRSNHSLQSAVSLSLRDNAALPAGSRFSEGNTTEVTRKMPAGFVPPSQGAITFTDAPVQTTIPTSNNIPFYKKRRFIISQLILIPLVIALIFILLFPVVRAIIQLVIKRSQLDLENAIISQPQNATFVPASFVTHTGIISANIEFPEPVDVSWFEDEFTETKLGTMTLPTLVARHKRAPIDSTTTFTITNEDAFGRFSAHLITAQNFTWHLNSSGLRVHAAKFPVAKGLVFDKNVTMNGFNSFSNSVILKDLQLPSDNSAGGINFIAVTQLNNPSPFSINLGTVVFALSYKNVFLGTGSAMNTLINPGTNDLTLSGFMKKQTDPGSLEAVSELFTSYLNGEGSPVTATGVSTLQADNSSISWLSKGLQSLSLTVPFKAPREINPIRAIAIGNLGLTFDENSPWSPSVESNSVQAFMQLPFGFNLAIDQIENDFTFVTLDGANIAGLSTWVLSLISGMRLLMADPDAALTRNDVVQFFLVGTSRAVTNTSLGEITLDPITVNVTTNLHGLQGLEGLTTIVNVDVEGGTPEGIDLGIDVSIFNPSDLDLTTGDLTLQLVRDGVTLGTSLIPDLNLARGNNTFRATSVFDVNTSPQGQETLNDFVGGKDVGLNIVGFNGSTRIASLTEAFGSLNISVTLPGLKTSLIDSATLEILPTTGRTNNVSHVTVSLINPFTAPLTITRISSTVSSFGILLGRIESNVEFKSASNSKTQSPTLNLDMNLDPAAIFTLTRALGVEAGLDVDPLDAIVELGGIKYLDIAVETPKAIRRVNMFDGFNLPSFVNAAFKKLRSEVELNVDVTIGDYKTTLQYTQTDVATVTDKSLDLLLPVLAQPIVQKIIAESSLGISSVLISDPKQNSFRTHLMGNIGNAGPFDATISFPSGLTVEWSGEPLGAIAMGDVKVIGDVGGNIDASSFFQVADVAHLTEFTKTMLTEDVFIWDISGQNITVEALGIVVPGITLTTKTLTLKGFNNLKGKVTIQTFDLPSNDPSGGIHLTLQATAENPSQVGIELSSIGFDTFAEDVLIAPVVSTGAINLTPESKSNISLAGRLIPQASADGLSVVSTIFNNFIQGKDSIVEIQGASAGSGDATWLNEAFKTLRVATVMPNRGVQKIIDEINLNELELLFTENTAYDPYSSSQSTDAKFTLPFGFPLDITALEQTLTIGINGTAFAQLAIPKTPAATDVQNRIVHLAFNDVPFMVFSDQHPTFDRFVAETTTGKTESLQLSGSASAEAQTAVGLLYLEGIQFSLDTSIEGLQGLNVKPVFVGSVDVNHGFPDFLLIKVLGTLYNPSNLTIGQFCLESLVQKVTTAIPGTGDVEFSLQFDDQTIGRAEINDLLIKPGDANYSIDVQYAPQGGAISAGRTLLQNFVQGIDVNTTIAGTRGSSSILSLQLALSQIHLSPVQLPALKTSLISSASLSFPVDIATRGLASTSFTLDNPFTASVNLLSVNATATYHTILLGRITNADFTSNPLHATSHSNATSPSLTLEFNLDPQAIIQLLVTASQENKVDIGPLSQLFQFVIENPDFKPPIVTSVDVGPPMCVSGRQFDVEGAILQALLGLKVDLAVQSSLRLDDFPVDLSFDQRNVPAATDKTVLYLIGAVASSVTQHLVDGAEMKFNQANITNITNDGFDLSLAGSLTNVGPLDAFIEFVEPLIVSWQGRDIGTLSLPSVCAAANIGVPDYQTTAHVTILSSLEFTEFATFLLHQPSFNWTISTSNLRLTALGTIFQNVSLSKVVSFKAFNGLPGVTISNFELPSDDPDGGIHVETDAVIPSAAQLGIDLGSISFEVFFHNTFIGLLSGKNVYLAAGSQTTTHLSGRLIPQSGADLDNMGILFSTYLTGENQTLIAKGSSVQPRGSNEPVTWLSTAFQSLSLEVIQSIVLSDLSVTLDTQEQSFAPPASSRSALAKYKSPFGFSLQIVEAGQNIVLASGGVDIAELTIPKSTASGGISTGNVADLIISFQNIPLAALDRQAFAQMFAGIALQPEVNLSLKGSADVTAKTSIGDIDISGVAFNVPSSLQGIDAFGHTAVLSNVSVQGSGGVGGQEFIRSPLTTYLQNPSNITLNTVDISLPVLYQGIKIGRAVIDSFQLRPGDNPIATEFRYQPDNANDTTAQAFLSQFIQTDDNLDITIHGDDTSSPFASLSVGLAQLQLDTQLTGLNQPNFITAIYVTITLESLVDNLVSVSFDVHNPLDAELVLEFVQSDSGLNGKTYAFFGQGFDSFIVPPGQTVNSGTFPNVLLTQGAIASLDIISEQQLDVSAATTLRIGQNGYEVPWLKLNQVAVPTTYNLVLSAAAMKSKAAAMSAASTTATSVLEMSSRSQATESATSVSGTSGASSMASSTVSNFA
ncbi:hypothetical protein H0H93_010219 [Arthromyces matolae]|nr:hypothetical protein H0H93_010219 [Arthromyces matolae]